MFFAPQRRRLACLGYTFHGLLSSHNLLPIAILFYYVPPGALHTSLSSRLRFIFLLEESGSTPMIAILLMVAHQASPHIPLSQLPDAYIRCCGIPVQMSSRCSLDGIIGHSREKERNRRNAFTCVHCTLSNIRAESKK